MACYVRIGEMEDAEELIEVPTESDGTMLLSSVSAQFPDAVGLRFKTESGAWRGCRVDGNTIDPPLDGWENSEYYVVTKKVLKRRADDDDVGPLAKLDRMTDEEILSDLMAAGLPYAATDAEVKQHFESFGELDMCVVKRDRDGTSRGFGFIRYKTVEAVEAALRGSHILKNRRYELNYSKRSQDQVKEKEVPTKLFVGRLPQGTTAVDLQKHFSQYGVLKDIYIPTPFKGYGFVLFASQEVAFKVQSETHVVKGVLLNIGDPIEKKMDGMSGQSSQGFGNMQGGMQSMQGGMQSMQGGMQSMQGGMQANANQMGNRQSNMSVGMNPLSWMHGKTQSNISGNNMNTPSWMQGKMQSNMAGNMNTPSWMQGKMQSSNMLGGMNTQSWMQGNMQNSMLGGMNTQSSMQGKMQSSMLGGMNTKPMQEKTQTQNGGSSLLPRVGYGYQGNGNYSWPVSQ